jgi:uncharacterized protein with FMN-binding domain
MPPADRPNRNLVALGSAAVIAVYAAGYIRTKPAAAKQAEDSAARRRPPATDAQVSAIAPREPGAPIALAKPEPPKDSVAKKKKKLEVDESELTPLPPDTVPSGMPTSMPVAVAPPQKPDSLRPGFPPWHDGTFYGWGTSRHGDIRAGVEIVDGKIARAFIADCRTQYSCSWIEHLPGQVVRRQSPEVDSVSSATQSADAFYYAVLEALKQAK